MNGNKAFYPADLSRILLEKFGFSAFRGAQEPALRESLGGRDVLLVMATGGGKSLCYQMLAHVDGPVLVLSPLIALMQDQVLAARGVGLRAEAVHSGMSGEERSRKLQRFAGGHVQLLLVTPERFRSPEFLSAVENVGVRHLVVDESHCVSQWGHDFRPDYSRVGEYRARPGLAGVPLLALTATATQPTAEDILQQLRMSNPVVLREPVLRANLELSVTEVMGWEQKVQAIMAQRHHLPGCGIVYFSLIQTLERIASELRRLGLKVLRYHGDMSPQDRKAHMEAFLESQQALMLATPAFGLGINKSDVRWVLHAEVPGSLEAYFQEVGRAGRDGARAQGVLLWDSDDLLQQMDFLKWTHPDREFVYAVHRWLLDHWDQFRSQGIEPLRQHMNFKNRRDFRVETTLNWLERWGVLAGPVSRPSELQWGTCSDLAAVDWKLMEDRRRVQQTKLHQMAEYASSKECRMQRILDYFADPPLASRRCGKCDNCLSAHPAIRPAGDSTDSIADSPAATEDD